MVNSIKSVLKSRHALKHVISSSESIAWERVLATFLGLSFVVIEVLAYLAGGLSVLGAVGVCMTGVGCCTCWVLTSIRCEIEARAARIRVKEFEVTIEDLNTNLFDYKSSTMVALDRLTESERRREKMIEDYNDLLQARTEDVISEIRDRLTRSDDGSPPPGVTEAPPAPEGLEPVSEKRVWNFPDPL